MSYISSADMAVLHPAAAPRAVARRVPGAPHLPDASPVGTVLEVVLMVATNAAVSLVFCTAVAGALLH